MTDYSYREDKAKIFAKHYALSLNGTQAAIKAGYSEKGAHVVATRMLKNDKVKGFIDEEKARLMEQINVTQAQIVSELSKIAFGNIGELVSWTAEGELVYKSSEDLTADQTAAIEEITNTKKFDNQGNPLGVDVKLKMHNKLKALDQLSKILGIYKDSSELEVKVINVNVED